MLYSLLNELLSVPAPGEDQASLAAFGFSHQIFSSCFPSPFLEHPLPSWTISLSAASGALGCFFQPSTSILNNFSSGVLLYFFQLCWTDGEFCQIVLFFSYPESVFILPRMWGRNFVVTALRLLTYLFALGICLSQCLLAFIFQLRSRL